MPKDKLVRQLCTALAKNEYRRLVEALLPPAWNSPNYISAVDNAPSLKDHLVAAVAVGDVKSFPKLLAQFSDIKDLASPLFGDLLRAIVQSGDRKLMAQYIRYASITSLKHLPTSSGITRYGMNEAFEQPGIGMLKDVIKLHRLRCKTVSNSTFYYWLLGAVRSKDVAKVQTILDLPINTPHLVPYYEFSQICRLGSAEVLKAILDKGFLKLDVTFRGMQPNHALEYALETGDVDKVKVFLDAGADPNGPANNVHDFEPPLHFAISRAQEDIVQLLLRRGALLHKYKSRTSKGTINLASNDPNMVILRLCLQAREKGT